MNKYLKDIFLHLDGIAMAPIYELIDTKKNNYNKQITITSSKYGDYTFILFKILKAQSIVKKKSTLDNSIAYEWTDYGKDLFSKNSFLGVRDYYILCINMLESNALDSKFFSNIAKPMLTIYKKSILNYGENSLIAKHIEGAMIAPILIYYKYNNPKVDAFQDILSNRKNDFLKLFVITNLIHNDTLTDKGQYLLSKSYAYGVTDSYMRTFIHLKDLCFNPNSKGCIDKKNLTNSKETHVNRALNVWGSGKSHTTYFKHIDNYVIDIFNKPIEQQPKGIADMGCGDGSFLYHLDDLVKRKTLRGTLLKSHPLLLIGADFNQAALDETSKMFSKNKNKPMTVLADISKPDKYAEKIKLEHSQDISNFLNVRSFLDHNRTYKKESNPIKYNFKNITSNSFVWKGKKVSSYEIQENLVNHFKKWKKYISKYGLLVLELHSIEINEIYKNIKRLPMTAYIATHGFSDQFIIEYEVYKECIDLAGLNIDESYEKLFPSIETKMISINLIN